MVRRAVVRVVAAFWIGTNWITADNRVASRRDVEYALHVARFLNPRGIKPEEICRRYKSEQSLTYAMKVRSRAKSSLAEPREFGNSAVLHAMFCELFLKFTS